MRADATASRTAIIDAAWQGFATNDPDISLRSIAQTPGSESPLSTDTSPRAKTSL